MTNLNHDAARTTILQRIRAANHAESNLPSAAQAWSAIPRLYRRTPLRSRADMLELFTERLRDYDAHLQQATADRASGAVVDAIAKCGEGPMLVAPGFPSQWLPENADLTPDNDFSPEQLNHFVGVITAATLGIAETGSLVLQNVPGQGRRAATLVPDIHICLLQSSNVVETVPEALARLAQTSHLPTTFISGPSATADIEMTRIKGVHGPRFLYVVLID
jgi:L-lactate dehydrogenase complex protein LldG